MHVFSAALSSKELQLNVRTYNIIIDEFCKAGKLIEVEILFEEMEEKGSWPDECTYNTLLSAFFKFNEVSKARELIKRRRMRKRGPANGSAVDLVSEEIFEPVGDEWIEHSA